MGSGLSALPLDEYRRAARTAIERGAVPALQQSWERHARTTPGGEPGDTTAALADAAAYHFGITHLRNEQARYTGTKPDRPRTADEPAFDALHDRVDIAPPALSRDVALGLEPRDLHELHRRAISPDRRHELGAYYTPTGVAALAADELGADWATDTVVDPGCGAGAFISVAARCKADTASTPEARIERVVDDLAGIEINPVAADAATAALAAALAPEIEAVDEDAITFPIRVGDALGVTDATDTTPPFDGRADHLLANPPWIPWERVSRGYRDRLVATSDVDLVPRTGAKRRLGHANDDLSLPFLWLAIRRFLAVDGTAAVVLKRDLLTQTAGRLLRTLDPGDGSLNVTHIHDFGETRPFDGVDTPAALLALERSTPDFPIDATRWVPTADAPRHHSLAAMRDTHDEAPVQFAPVGPDTASPWVPGGTPAAAVGETAHPIRHGLKDDADDVFGVTPDDLDRVDADLVYPYLRSRHAAAYATTGHDLRLVPAERAGEDNEDWLRREYPDTHAYLEDHRETLESRSSDWFDPGAFYALFGLGPYTWADYKVAWCRLGFNPEFSVVSTRSDSHLGERPVVPGDHYLFIPTDDPDEAHFLCALLNSAPYQRALEGLSAGGKAGLSKSVVSRLELPEYAPLPDMRRLAALSRDAHARRRADAEADVADIQTEIDAIVEARATSRGTLFPEVGQRTLDSLTDSTADDGL